MATTSSATSTMNKDYIPLIDFSLFLSNRASSAQRKQVAASVLNAFTTSGFIYLSNHGISPSEIARMFAVSARFFARPQSEKDALEWDSPESNRGYTSMGREKVSQGLSTDVVAEVRAQEGQDLKESFEVGRETDPVFSNHWPRTSNNKEGDTEFREESVKFFDSCKQLHVQVMRALALALGIDEDWFDQFTSDGDNTLRLLHYPAVEKSVFQRNKLQLRAGAHSDYGSITLLFQDDRGGLQVRAPDGTFIDAKPIKDTIVINAGDLLARWSNDLVKSTVHRVVEPPLATPTTTTTTTKPVHKEVETELHPARYSIAYFCNPNFDKMIETIPGTIEAGQEAKYEPVNSGEYLVRRLAATY